MTSPESRLYDFVYRAHLTEQALDAAGRRNRRLAEFESSEIARVLSLDLLDDEHIDNVNHPGNRGGCLVKVRQVPQRVLQVDDSIVPQLLPEECRQLTPAGVDG